MDRTEAARRLAAARVGRLATVTRDGGPHVVACCFALADGRVYSAVDAKPKSTLALRRLDNLRANPAAALLVDHYEDDWSRLWWVRADGRGRILDATDPGGEHELALRHLAAKYPQYGEVRPPGAVIAIEVERWSSWSAAPDA